jgi:hypothetical protein
MIDYYLKSDASGPITLEILEKDGRVVRRYSSEDPVTPIPDPPNAPVPVYWYRQPQVLSTRTGMHRFIWDVHYDPLPARAGGGGLSIQAIPRNSAPALTTPWVNPGVYTVKLTVNGKSVTQPLTVKQDPRVKTPALEMQRVYTMTKAMYDGAVDAQRAAMTLADVRQQAAKRRAEAKDALAAALDAFNERAAALEGTRPGEGGGGRGGRGGGPPAAQGGGRGAGGAAAPAETLWGVSTAPGSIGALMNSMQAADVAPTANTLAAITRARQQAASVMTRWNAMRTVEIPALNAKLKAAGLAPITAALSPTHPQPPGDRPRQRSRG